MKTLRQLLAVMLLTAGSARCADAIPKQFLRYLYGADGVELTAICHPSDDLWMLRGAKNEKALSEIDSLKIEAKLAGIFSYTINNGLGVDVCFIELRDGKIDPAFNLDGVGLIHRQMALQFIYAAVAGDQRLIGRLVTDASKVQIIGPKAAPGDMDVYGGVIQIMPVVRSSKPAEDAKSKTVTYRLPLGDIALSLILLQTKDGWKIDTSRGVRVPLEFFYRTDAERTILSP
jgi:hypothetical protein